MAPQVWHLLNKILKISPRVSWRCRGVEPLSATVFLIFFKAFPDLRLCSARRCSFLPFSVCRYFFWALRWERRLAVLRHGPQQYACPRQQLRHIEKTNRQCLHVILSRSITIWETPFLRSTDKNGYFEDVVSRLLQLVAICGCSLKARSYYSGPFLVLLMNWYKKNGRRKRINRKRKWGRKRN